MDPSKNSSDEIDLRELFINIIIFTKRNFALFLSFFLIGVLLGVLYTMLATKVYESKMMVTSTILTQAYIDQLGENLDDIIEDKNYELLSQRLSITTDEAKKIKHITLKSAIKEITDDKKDFSFIITVDLTDSELFPKVQHGIVMYFENNDYVKARVDQQKNIYEKLISRINDEIKSLEGLKTEIYTGEFFKNNKGNLMFDPTEVNSKIILLLGERLNYEKALALSNSVQVVEGFTKFNDEKEPNKAVALTAGASLGLFFVGLLFAFKSIRALLRKVEKDLK